MNQSLWRPSCCSLVIRILFYLFSITWFWMVPWTISYHGQVTNMLIAYLNAATNIYVYRKYIHIQCYMCKISYLYYYLCDHHSFSMLKIFYTHTCSFYLHYICICITHFTSRPWLDVSLGYCENMFFFDNISASKRLLSFHPLDR